MRSKKEGWMEDVKLMKNGYERRRTFDNKTIRSKANPTTLYSLKTAFDNEYHGLHVLSVEPAESCL